MVKGISRQVIVVHSPDRKLFEQAIFLLNDDAPQVTEAQLLQEAQKMVKNPSSHNRLWQYGAFWATVGAATTGIAWLLTILLA